MKNHIIGIKDNVLYLSEFDSNWSSTYESEDNLLADNLEIILENSINNLKSGNDILLIKDSFSNEYFNFGIKIAEDGSIPNKSLLNLYSLCETEKNSYYPTAYHQSVNFNSFYTVNSFFECSECSSLLKLLEEAGKYASIYCLYLNKTGKDKVCAKLVLASDNLYDLKTASKFFRDAGQNYEEYFYQKEECIEVLKSISNRENINIAKDDAHRVIFENTNKGDNQIEK